MEESVPCAYVKIKFHSFHEPVNYVMYSDNTSVFGKSDCGTDLVCARLATSYLDSAGQIILCFCLLDFLLLPLSLVM